MSKIRFRNIISIFLGATILFWLTLIDWDNLMSRSNSGGFLGILAPIVIIISLQLQNKQEKNNS